MQFSRSVATALAALVVLFAPDAFAFHGGGVAACEGCHTMHGTPEQAGTAGAYLLLARDPSSICLNCHARTALSAHAVFTTGSAPGIPPANYTPGGDFAWVTKSYAWLNGTTQETSPGDRHGHNVVASEYGLFADANLTTSPGGSFPANSLSCTSCHDPHGRWRLLGDGSFATTGAPIVSSGSYGGAVINTPTASTAVGVYRLLAGRGYVQRSAGAAPLAVDPPVALAPPVYNQSERAADVRVAYGAGMSEWCANCHGAIHTAPTTSSFLHPSGAQAKLGVLATWYNGYVKDGELSGTQDTSFTSLVPYEEGTADRAVLAPLATSDGSARAGPNGVTEAVMCLTCHRAHASGWDGALRWNMRYRETESIVAAGQWPGTDAIGDPAKPTTAQGRRQAETRAAMYDREPSAFAPYQKALCSKCHDSGG